MPKLVGTGLNQVPMNSMLGGMAFQDITSYFRAVQGTAVASTSGTSIDFTGLPTWVKRITVLFNGVSTNGSNSILVQVGAGSVTSNGYTSTAVTAQASSTTVGGSSTSGFLVSTGAAANVLSGEMRITLVSGNTWLSAGLILQTTAGTLFGQMYSGAVTLSGLLDRVRITTVGGTDTFDAGSVNIIYEG